MRDFPDVPVSWDQLPDFGSDEPPLPGPRRVVDGLIATTLARPVWSLGVGGLARDGHLDELVRVAREAGKRCVYACGSGGTVTLDGLEAVAVPDLAGLGTALALDPAVITHVGVDTVDDGWVALAAGLRPLLIGHGPVQRGAVYVESCAKLRGLLLGTDATVATTTYHEI